MSDAASQASGELPLAPEPEMLKPLPLPTPLQAAIASIPQRQATQEFNHRLFQQALLDCLHEGIIFVDPQCRVKAWSHSVELMTGTKEETVLETVLTPAIMNLCDNHSEPIGPADCPIAACLRTEKIKKDSYRVIGRSGREVKIDLCASPVFNDNDEIQGVIAQLHDASVQLDLQRQLKDLYEFSVLDPLTQVANRAEFERVLEDSIRMFQSKKHSACSLIICDIDFFKSINDNYGHHIGDQALIAFATQLKQHVRSNDLVARYGGEEFVILCPDCDLESAQQRAEDLRTALARTPQQMLDGKCITASFGVSELRTNETGTDFFVRADTALLKAKELGRNRVVIASTDNVAGDGLTSVDNRSLSGLSWRQTKGKSLISEEFVTQTPTAVLVEKIRGYIFDFDAEIRQVEADFISMEVTIEDPTNYSRRGTFRVLVELQEVESDEEKLAGNRKKSFIRITIREAKRKWFSTNEATLAPDLLMELRRYLMINDDASMLKVDPAATRPAHR